MYFALLTRKRDFISLRNCSKLVERCFFAIIDWLIRSEIYSFVLYMACGGMIFINKFQILEKKIFILFFLSFNFENGPCWLKGVLPNDFNSYL